MDLLERGREVDALSRVLAAAAGGGGQGVAVTGEPGVGKSALVESVCAGARGLRVLRSGCDPLVTPRPLGPFRDLLAHLRPMDRNAPLAVACEAAFEALRAEPTVLVVEDVHWVDAASVEVLRFLVRRLDAMPCALVVTYRDDEIGAQHSARPLLGDFAVLDRLTTLRLAPLSVDGVGLLLDGSGLDASTVHGLTGGNPFFVAEVAKDPDRPLPATVRDAVLARTAGIAAADLEVLQLAAAAPDRLDDRVLPALGVDLPTLWRLHDTGLLLRNRHGLVFRHELARLALESTIPAGGAARLHARLLDALERIEPRDPAVLTHHAVAAADAPRAARYAQDAAEEAARAGSHSDAVAFLHIAASNVDGAYPGQRAKVLTRLAYEQYMTSRLDAAIGSASATFSLWRAADDPAGLSAAHESCALFEYYSARRLRAEEHADRAAAVTSVQAGAQYGHALLIQGYLAYHQNRFERARALMAGAGPIARSLGDDALDLRSRLMRAMIDHADAKAGARQRLLSLIEEAKADGLDELASAGYSNLAYHDVEQRRLAGAREVLGTSLAFTIERDIPICNHWQTAVRARLGLLQGDWDAAAEDSATVLGRAGMPLAAMWPHLISALLPIRRDGAANAHFDAAWDLSERLDEPLRRLPTISALAERMWLTGEPDDRVTADELHGVVGTPATAWVVGDLAVWLRRLGIDVEVDPGVVAEPHRLSLAGRHAEAAAWWARAGAVFDEAMALSDGDEVHHKTTAIERLDRLGATAVADRLRHSLRQRRITHVPQRPRASTRGNPGGLTNRQLDVARLVARGYTNAEIAGKLFISVKTADHHVSAVLTKLGTTNRRAIAAHAEELGLT
jgi:DNA-binding CsgD family transcriptional regulator